jgi:phosphopantetheine adenylyltransferase
MIIERYDTTAGPAMLLIVMSPPKRRSKGKRKEYDKAFQKSIQQGKVFSSKDFSTIQQHLLSVFPTIITPRNKILEEFQTILAGLILGFVPIQNVKYSVKSLPGKNFVVYESVQARHYAFLVSIVGMKDDGLYLAHENQMAFITQEIDSGKNPNFIRNIPSLQKGSDLAPQKVTSQKPADHQAIKKFRQHLKQKKDVIQIQEELDYETVIDFASRQNSSNGLPTLPSSSAPVSSSNQTRPAPLPHPAAVPVSIPQIIPNSFSGLHPQPNTKSSGIDTNSPEKRDVDSEIEQLQTQLSLITDTLTKQLAEKDEDINSYKDKIEKLQETLEKIQHSNQELTQLNLKMQAITTENNEEIIQLNENNEKIVRTVQQLEQKNRTLSVELQDAVQDADQRYHNTMGEKLNLEIIATELQEELADLRRKLNME